MPDSGPRVLVVGSANMDLVVETPRAPDAGETLLGHRFTTGFGGKGANQAVMARLAGAEVAFVACVGADAHGAQTLAELTRRGIDVDGVATAPDVASGVAQIWVEDGGANRIIVVPGANARLDPDRVAAAVARDRAAVVIGQLEVPQAATAAGFAAARARGAVTVLNPAPAALLADVLLAETDWLVPNEPELAALSGGADVERDADLAAFARDAGVRLLVTLGAAGAALVRADGTVLRAPAPVVAALDTTGAGDAFIGTFAARLAAGETEERAVAAALRCAADSVTRLGAQSSFPDPDRAARLIADR
jgi:ribokinase